MFKIELTDNSIFKEAFDSISRIVDEVMCEVDSEGFRLTALDRSHITFVAFKLNKELFDTFECDVSEKICFDTQDFMKILKRAKKTDTLGLESDGANLIIKFYGDVDKVFKIRLLDLEYDNPTPPTLNTPVSVSMMSSLLKDCLTDMELFSDTLYFMVDSEYFYAGADSEFGDSDFKYLHGEGGISETVKSSFNIPKLKDIMSASKFSDVVTVGVGNDMPLIVIFELESGDGELRYLLAPRLETEE